MSFWDYVFDNDWQQRSDLNELQRRSESLQKRLHQSQANLADEVQVAVAHFNHINLGPRLDEFVNVGYMDAKNYLHVTDRKYDVIINGANVPSYSAARRCLPRSISRTRWTT